MRLGDIAMFYRFMDFAKECASYIDALSRIIRHEYRSGKIDLHSYERQINYLTVIKLQLEEMDRIAKEQTKKGAFVDAYV
jgi:hypothetical protein